MTAEQYWKEFTTENPHYSNKSYASWQFGAEPDELAVFSNGTRI